MNSVVDAINKVYIDLFTASGKGALYRIVLYRIDKNMIPIRIEKA
jgi:hypothetical protein